MSIRAYKITIAVMLGVILLLGWWSIHLLRQQISARFIDQQCMITQDMVEHPGDGFVPEGLVMRLDFLMGYYDHYSKPLAGSPIKWMVQREYQQTLTNAVDLLRSQTTNDLGSDPRAWIRKYEK